MYSKGSKCVAQDHNQIYPAKPRTRTATQRPKTNIFSVRLSRAVSKRLSHVDMLYSDYSLQVLSGMHNRTIIGFGFRMIASIIKTLVCVISLNVGLDISRYQAQRHSVSYHVTSLLPSGTLTFPVPRALSSLFQNCTTASL